MRRIVFAIGLLAVFAGLGTFGFAVGSDTRIAVSQKGRSFAPAALEIARGDTVAIHNDDEYVHQVFVDNPGFKFDSGEQRIGQTVEITFPVAGAFRVLCAIHPKMRLDVVVK
jgi:plastocyanin